MVLMANTEVPVYFKERAECQRNVRFCIKPINTIQPKTDKKSPDDVNVQIVRGKTTTFIHLDEEEAKKVQHHGDYVLKKIQRIHKSLIWNFIVGRSYTDKIQRGKQPAEEVNIDSNENLDFEPLNPKTWSDESLEFIENLIKASEFNYDGFVVLFCVANDSKDTSVDYDELAWELEKSLTYHFIGNKSQVIMNEEAIMSRKGLDPVSRKTKTPGKKKSGYCVYLAYQLIDSVCQDQIIGETLNKCVDLGTKRKQMLGALSEVKLMPQYDEKLRKQVKEMKEFMTKDQLVLTHKLREIKEAENLEMLNEFMTFIGSARERKSGMVGLPQFLSFLNKSDETDTIRAQNTSSNRATSSRISSATNQRPVRGSTLPRPTSAHQASSSPRKPSNASSQHTYSVSSRSTTPDKNGAQRIKERRESSLPSIQSSGSATSEPETLKREGQKPNLVGKSSRSQIKPRPQSSRLPAGSKGPSSTTKPITISKTTRTVDEPGSRSGTPRSTRSSLNGDSPRLITPSSSPRTNKGPLGRSSRPIPPDGKIITREDLRRMNRSYPSPKSRSKPPSSFSKAGF